MRIVLDTNVLIDALTDESNVQSKLVDAVIDGEIEAVYTLAVKREYELIRDRMARSAGDMKRINDLLAAVAMVNPGAIPVRPDDDEDSKFIAAATGGQADVLVTSDRHLLQLGEFRQISVMTPSECWHRFEDEQRGTSGVWHEWTKLFNK